MDLAEKTEEMISFLMTNLKGFSMERKGNDLLYSTGRNEYYIKTFSRQRDFPVDFTYNPNNFDEDRRRLNVIKETLDSFISDKNREGLHPAFLFLRAETEYGRVVRNQGHFLKQKTRDAHNDVKVLDPLELVVLQYCRKNGVNRDKRKVFGKIYRPELAYYNSKERRLERVWFSDMDGDMKLDRCPVCGKRNGEAVHSPCKTERSYLSYVFARERNRYEKSIWIGNKRKKEISLRPARLEDSFSSGNIGLFV